TNSFALKNKMTKQEFELLFSELEESGKSIKDFMADKKLPVHRCYYWKKRYNGINSNIDENPKQYSILIYFMLK
ncbi:MAG: hypothetical protein M3Q56_00660, partial [Bacteroidota bacterium]|nr:hypothetical protein [Bacteroidota bacterium]